MQLRYSVQEARGEEEDPVQRQISQIALEAQVERSCLVLKIL